MSLVKNAKHGWKGKYMDRYDAYFAGYSKPHNVAKMADSKRFTVVAWLEYSTDCTGIAGRICWTSQKYGHWCHGNDI